MQRAQYATRGPVAHEVIECVDFTLPPLTAGEALIEVLASPINPSDVLTLTGEYGMLPPLPAVGGNEGIGRIAGVGADVSLPIGQRVVLPIGVGSWTSHLSARADSLIALPAIGDVLQLSMLSVNPPTASLLLSEFVSLTAGDWVIQNTANSAVGRYLIQIAKRRGLRTVNVVRREDVVDELKQIGGDIVLVDGPDLVQRVREETAGAKIRLGVDAAAGSATDRIVRCVAVGGTVVNYGAMSGKACNISPDAFVFRDVTLRGFWLAMWFRTEKPEVRRALYAELVRLIADGALHAPVQATFALSQIKEAVAAAASGERSGKIVLVPNGA